MMNEVIEVSAILAGCFALDIESFNIAAAVMEVA